MGRIGVEGMQFPGGQGLIMDAETRLSLVFEAFRDWISPGNQSLSSAIDRTLQDGLFGYSDIERQLKSLAKGCTEAVLRRWIADQNTPSHRRVLSLHAGNLPLAGFQDVIAVLLSGGTYIGKLSRRDPWILESLLRMLKERGAKVEGWSSTLDGLASHVKMPADAMMFSGSPQSLPALTERLLASGLIHSHTPSLIRRSSLSVFHDVDGSLGSSDAILDQLAHGMMAYDNRGCRSIGVVVSPVPLTDIQCALTDAAERFLLRHRGLPVNAAPFLYEMAYERASGRAAVWLDRLLVIQKEDGLPDRPGVVHWHVGGGEALSHLIKHHSASLQAVYVAESYASTRSHSGAAVQTLLPGRNPEPLEKAQAPDIDWRPDGIDPIQWLNHLPMEPLGRF